MKKNTSYIFVLFSAFLVFSCQDSPTQIEEINENNISAVQATGPNMTQSNLAGPGHGEPDECLEDPNDPINVILDCEGPGGGNPGSGPSSPNLMYFNSGRTDSDLYYSFNSVDFSNPSQISWSGNTETPNTAQTMFGPAAVYFNNRVYAFYQNRRSSPYLPENIWFSSTSVSPINWSSNNILPVSNISATPGQPAAISFNNKMYVFFKIFGSVEMRYTTSSDGINWADSLPIPNDADMVSAPYPVVFNNTLYLFYIDFDDLPGGGTTSTVMSAYTTDGINWTLNTHPTPAPRESSPVVLGNTLYLIYRDSSNNLWSTSTTDVQNWTNPVRILNAKTSSRPTAVAKNGNIIVLHKGATLENIHMVYSNNGTTWTDGGHVPGLTYSAPYIIAID